MPSTDVAAVVSELGIPVLTAVRDIDEASETMSRFGLRPGRLVPLAGTHDLDAEMRVIPPADGISFARISYGADVLIMPTAPEDDAFMFVLTLAGRAGFRYGAQEVVTEAGHGGFIPPYREFRSHASADYDQIVVAFDRARLERTASVLADRDLGAVEFDYDTDVVAVSAEVRSILAATARMAASTGEHSTLRARTLLEDVVFETLLMSMPSFRARLGGAAAHGPVVASAMEFIETHLSEPIGLARLAAHAHVGPRALQLAFKAETGRSPLQWVKQRRLEHARRMLEDPASDHLRIADVAHLSGFLHLGDFARAFAEAFGAAPSALRRSRRSTARPPLHAPQR